MKTFLLTLALSLGAFSMGVQANEMHGIPSGNTSATMCSLARGAGKSAIKPPVQSEIKPGTTIEG